MATRRIPGLRLPVLWVKLGLTVAACVGQGVPVRGQDRVQPLLDGLRSPDTTVRLASARLMGDLAQASRSQYSELAEQTMRALRQAAPELAKLVRDPDARVRRAAVEALGQTRAAGAIAGPALAEALRDRSVRLRVAAAEAVAAHALSAAEESKVQLRPGDRLHGWQRFIEDAPELLKPLDAALRDADGEVRRAGLRALTQLTATLDNVGQISAADLAGPPQQAALDALKKGLLPVVQGYEALMPALVENLRAEALAAPAAKVVEDLIRLSQPVQAKPTTRGALANPIVQPEGMTAAGLLQGALRKLVPALAGAVKSANDQVQLAAMEALEMLGADAAGAVSDLTSALTDGNPFVRWAAARTLGKVGRAEPEAIRGLARLLRDEDLDVRSAAAISLGQFGERGAPAAADLSQAVAQGDPDLQTNAIRSLRSLGGAANEGVPALRSALKSPETRVRRAAAELLGDIGPPARTAVPGLEALLNDPESDVRQAAGQAILKIITPK